ncbi:MAG: CBS domain-containing protein [Solirubrobacterales bacterium]
MPDSIVKEIIQEVEPLQTSSTVGDATRRVIDSGIPGLPVVDANGDFAGIFGEREFMGALLPGYFKELGSSAMIRRSIDHTIDRREGCVSETIEAYMTTDHVLVEDDYSDTHLAELFLHYRVLVIPIATKGKIHAVVTRSDFFRSLATRFLDQASG